MNSPTSKALSPRAKAHRIKISRKQKFKKNDLNLTGTSDDGDFDDTGNLGSISVHSSHSPEQTRNYMMVTTANTKNSTSNNNTSKIQMDVELLRIQLSETLQENNQIKMRLHVELKDRFILEAKNNELNEKLINAGKVLQETGTTLFKLQKATDQLMKKRDHREIKLQKALEINKQLETRVIELETRILEMGDRVKVQSTISHYFKIIENKNELIQTLETEHELLKEKLSKTNKEALTLIGDKNHLEEIVQSKENRILQLEANLSELNTNFKVKLEEEAKRAQSVMEKALKVEQKNNENLLMESELSMKLKDIKLMEEKFAVFDAEKKNLADRVHQLESRITATVNTANVNAIATTNSIDWVSPHPKIKDAKFDANVAKNYDPLFSSTAIVNIEQLPFAFSDAPKVSSSVATTTNNNTNNNNNSSVINPPTAVVVDRRKPVKNVKSTNPSRSSSTESLVASRQQEKLVISNNDVGTVNATTGMANNFSRPVETPVFKKTDTAVPFSGTVKKSDPPTTTTIDSKKVSISNIEVKKSNSNLETKKSDSSLGAKKPTSSFDLKKSDSKLEVKKAVETAEMRKKSSQTNLSGEKNDTTLPIEKNEEKVKTNSNSQENLPSNIQQPIVSITTNTTTASTTNKLVPEPEKETEKKVILPADDDPSSATFAAAILNLNVSIAQNSNNTPDEYDVRPPSESKANLFNNNRGASRSSIRPRSSTNTLLNPNNSNSQTQQQLQQQTLISSPTRQKTLTPSTTLANVNNNELAMNIDGPPISIDNNLNKRASDANLDPNQVQRRAAELNYDLSIQLRNRLLFDKKILKKEIYQWQKTFKAENDREPTREDREKHAKPMYMSYKRNAKQLKDLEDSLGIPAKSKLGLLNREDSDVDYEMLNRSISTILKDYDSKSKDVLVHTSNRNDSTTSLLSYALQNNRNNSMSFIDPNLTAASTPSSVKLNSKNESKIENKSGRVTSATKRNTIVANNDDQQEQKKEKIDTILEEKKNSNEEEKADVIKHETTKTKATTTISDNKKTIDNEEKKDAIVEPKTANGNKKFFDNNIASEEKKDTADVTTIENKSLNADSKDSSVVIKSDEATIKKRTPSAGKRKKTLFEDVKTSIEDKKEDKNDEKKDLDTSMEEKKSSNEESKEDAIKSDSVKPKKKKSSSASKRDTKKNDTLLTEEGKSSNEEKNEEKKDVSTEETKNQTDDESKDIKSDAVKTKKKKSLSASKKRDLNKLEILPEEMKSLNEEKKGNTDIVKEETKNSNEESEKTIDNNNTATEEKKSSDESKKDVITTVDEEQENKKTIQTKIPNDASADIKSSNNDEKSVVTSELNKNRIEKTKDVVVVNEKNKKLTTEKSIGEEKKEPVVVKKEDIANAEEEKKIIIITPTKATTTTKIENVEKKDITPTKIDDSNKKNITATTTANDTKKSTLQSDNKNKSKVTLAKQPSNLDKKINSSTKKMDTATTSSTSTINNKPILKPNNAVDKSPLISTNSKKNASGSVLNEKLSVEKTDNSNSSKQNAELADMKSLLIKLDGLHAEKNVLKKNINEWINDFQVQHKRDVIKSDMENFAKELTHEYRRNASAIAEAEKKLALLTTTGTSTTNNTNSNAKANIISSSSSTFFDDMDGIIGTETTRDKIDELIIDI